jgi:hypothetical protein
MTYSGFLSVNVLIIYGAVFNQDLRFLPAAPCYTSAISACGACHMKDDALALFHEARRLKVLDKYVIPGVPPIITHVCPDIKANPRNECTRHTRHSFSWGQQ